jgi:hypothetical protein
MELSLRLAWNTQKQTTQNVGKQPLCGRSVGGKQMAECGKIEGMGGVEEGEVRKS